MLLRQNVRLLGERIRFNANDEVHVSQVVKRMSRLLNCGRPRVPTFDGLLHTEQAESSELMSRALARRADNGTCPQYVGVLVRRGDGKN